MRFTDEDMKRISNSTDMIFSFIKENYPDIKFSFRVGICPLAERTLSVERGYLLIDGRPLFSSEIEKDYRGSFCLSYDDKFTLLSLWPEVKKSMAEAYDRRKRDMSEEEKYKNDVLDNFEI